MTWDEVATATFNTLWNTKLSELLGFTLKGDPGNDGAPGQSGGGTTFGGRLTLVSGEPFMGTDQVAKQVIYYAPCNGDSLPMVVDGEITPVKFLSGPTDQVGLSLSLAGSSAWAAGTIHDVFAVMDGETPRLATRQWDSAMFPTEELITGGTPISGTASGASWATPGAAFDGNPSQSYSAAARLYPANSGMNNFIGQQWATPQAVSRIEFVAANDNLLINSGTTAGFIKSWGTDGAATWSAPNWNMLGYIYADCSANGNVNSFPINVGNRVLYGKLIAGLDADGTNRSINIAEMKCYREVAPATRRLTRFAGLHVNDEAFTARVGASETLAVLANSATYLGTIRIDPDAPGRVTAHFEYGPSRKHNIWNAYNRRQIIMRAGKITSGASAYSLPSHARWGACQQDEGFSLDALVGLAEEHVSATFYRAVFLNSQSAVTQYECGIGVDTTAAFSGKVFAVNVDTTGQAGSEDGVAKLTLPKYAGTRKLIGIERGIGNVSPCVDQRSTVLEAVWFG